MTMIQKLKIASDEAIKFLAKKHDQTIEEICLMIPESEELKNQYNQLMTKAVVVLGA